MGNEKADVPVVSGLSPQDRTAAKSAKGRAKRWLPLL